jgi:hypothetical protein
MQSHLVNSYRVDANLTGLATAAIYAMHLCWERSDMPSNFTPFYLYRQLASDYGDNADGYDNLAASLKAASGAPLSDIEAKKLTAAKMMRLNTPDEALYMIRFFYRICCMIWGKATIVSSSILDVTNHLTTNHLIYDQVTQTDPNFPTKVVFIVDQAVHHQKRSSISPSTSSGKEPDDKYQQKKKQRKSDQDDKPKDRKKLATNTQDLPCARIKPNEK